MTLIILFFALGILLLAVEVIVPGAILGSIGGLLMFGGCVKAFMEYGTGGGIVSFRNHQPHQPHPHHHHQLYGPRVSCFTNTWRVMLLLLLDDNGR